jgi:hypothetical protein
MFVATVAFAAYAIVGPHVREGKSWEQKCMNINPLPQDISATRITAMALGIVTGIAGMEHGFFELLQGNVASNGLVIEAIGPIQRFWELGTEPALTILPNFLVTGILAMTLGLAMIIWSGAFVHKKQGAPVLAFLTIGLFLFGGGFAPIGSALVAILAAARINKPLTWWKKHLPVRIQGFLTKSWKWSLVIVVIVYLYCLWVAIFGWPLTLFFDATTVNNIQLVTGLGLLAVMVYLLPAGFAFDIQKHVKEM